MKETIYPVILGGGTGKRLWPVSRQSYPKQFSKILGTYSLFQNTIKRFQDHRFEDPIILTSNDYRFIVSNQLKDLKASNSAILIEPSARDTAPAVLAAALWIERSDENAIMMVLPSDHAIHNPDNLKSTLYNAISLVLDGYLVTIGIEPVRAETGYGWLQYAEVISGTSRTRHIEKFIEKPDENSAKCLLEQENCLWNSGIYLFTTKSIIQSFSEHAPDLLFQVSEAVDQSSTDLGFVRLDESAWNKIQGISIDYAIMEHANNILVLPYTNGWNDLGDWNAVWREIPTDNNGNCSSGLVHSIDCHDSYLRSENTNQQLVAIGCRNLIVVTMPDAVLVTSKDEAQKVKSAVTFLTNKGVPQAEQFPIEHRLWGKLETLTSEDQLRINRIVIKPFERISLQIHKYRAEHWIVLEGYAKITIDEDECTLSPGQSAFVQANKRHSIENSTSNPLIIIEVQTGKYVGEDDITRYETDIS